MLGAEFGEFQSYNLIDHGMAHVVGRVMRERSQGEGIFVDVGRFTQKGAHEISAAHVMQQVAEVFLAEWIVTHVLDKATAIGEGVSVPKVLGCCVGEALDQHALKLVFPG